MPSANNNEGLGQRVRRVELSLLEEIEGVLASRVDLEVAHRQR